MAEICDGCVLEDLPDGEVLFAVATVQVINAKHANGFDWVEEARSLESYPISIVSLHELGSTALKAQDYTDDQLDPARKCAAMRLTGSCSKP